jgi:hypothetical protein
VFFPLRYPSNHPKRSDFCSFSGSGYRLRANRKQIASKELSVGAASELAIQSHDFLFDSCARVQGVTFGVRECLVHFVERGLKKTVVLRIIQSKQLGLD